MTNQDQNPPTFPPPRPAMPVAPGTPAPPNASGGFAPAITQATTTTAPKRAKKRAKKRKVKTAPVKAKRKVVRRERVLVPSTPKNPNRPLEAKNQLQAVLAALPLLKKPEQSIFTDMVATLGNLTRSGRQRILAGLSAVYS